LKVSLAEINALMTSNANSKAAGMGTSGDAYLVGADQTTAANDELSKLAAVLQPLVAQFKTA